MRNVCSARMRAALTALGAIALLASAGGCVPPEGGAAGEGRGGGGGAPAAVTPPPPLKPLKPRKLREALDAAYAAFARKQYGEALAGADRVLAGNPQSPGAAEAQYLRGRVFEQRSLEAATAGKAAAAETSLRSARDAYNAALRLTPAPSVQGLAEAGLANVAYHQEDYATAVAQWSAAAEKIADPQAKARVLYRLARSQQRLGNFPEADRTFAAIRQQFPGTAEARQATAQQGARGFHVQVGTFDSPANADAALAQLWSAGVVGLRLPDAAGRHVVRVGPVQTYAQAKTLKARLANRYPGTLIIP